MASGQLATVVRRIRMIAAARGNDGPSDAVLLERFVIAKDQSAFETLLGRHGPLVLGVCLRVLGNRHDADDAFQATFLVLTRKARSIRKQRCLASWLYRVAYRLALQSRLAEARRRRRERQVPDMQQKDTTGDLAWRELRPLLDQELDRLPDKYRLPLLLCYAQGQTHAEAARCLGWPKGTVAGRLARARMLLRKRLTQRGVVLSTGALGLALSQPGWAAALPVPLAAATVEAAMLVVAGKAAALGALAGEAVALSDGMMQTMLITKLRSVVTVILVAGALLSGTGMFAVNLLATASGQESLIDAPGPIIEIAPGRNKAVPGDIPGLPEEVRENKKWPGSFWGRGPATRHWALKNGGGTRESEAAVARGLKWLVRHQEPNGCWRLDGERGTANDVAGTALGLLPFLGAGFTHKPAAANPYDRAIERGLAFLLRKQDKRSGDFGGGMYAHGLASIAVCEAFGLTRDPALRRPAQQAVDYIVRAQHVAGGWRYAPGQAGDTSVTGWQVMALKTAQMAGLDVPAETLQKASGYLDSCCDQDSEGYRYVGSAGSVTPSMTASGLLCRQYLENWGPGNAGGFINRLMKAVDNNIKPSPPGKMKNMYYCYYATQVMHHIGGTVWKDWNEKMRDLLVTTQDTDEGPNNGSWSSTGDLFGAAGGRLLVTSFSLLTLEVYYRHLPLHLRY
jgi:RNA polymerase sigma factor (sigma-70 family)